MDNYSSVPGELKALPQWVCYCLEEDKPGHFKKLPLDPNTMKPAKANDPRTWGTFDKALSRVDPELGMGIGFEFANGYFGIDLDHVDEYDPVAQDFLTALRTYAERSPSGTGIHVLCRGSLPKGRRRRDNIEMYETGRFFTVTGDCIQCPGELTDCTEAAQTLHAKYLGGDIDSLPGMDTDSLSGENMDLERAFRGANGDELRDLLNGDWRKRFESQSEADLRACAILAYYSKNPTLIDSAIRGSKLYRPKWDEKRGAKTYGEMTIAQAVATTPGKSDYSVRFTDEKIGPYGYDDIGNGKLFQKLNGKCACYSYVNRVWYVYDGHRWVEDRLGCVRGYAKEAVEVIKNYPISEDDEKLRAALAKHVKRSSSVSGLKAMLEAAQDLMPVLPAQFDRDPMLLNAIDLTYSIKTGKSRPQNPSDMVTRVAGAKLDLDAQCPMWRKFLEEIFLGDMELIDYIQRVCGYTLTGDTSEQCFFVLYGDGGNGKSVFLEVLAEAFGDYATNCQPSTILMKPGSPPIPSDIARLKGARLVTCAEPNEGLRLDEGLVKQLTGSDRITARKLYGDEFEFRPEFKLFIATNHRPTIRGRDSGIWRRVRLIPFLAQFDGDKRDPKLRQRLRSELPGILAWCVEGARLWLAEGALKTPSSVSAATADYRTEMDDIATFFTETCRTREGMRIEKKDLYFKYSEWCKQAGEKPIHRRGFMLAAGKKFEIIRSNGRDYFQNLTCNL